MRLYRTRQEEQERQARLKLDFLEAAQLVMLIGTLSKEELEARLQQMPLGAVLMFTALCQDIAQQAKVEV